MKLVAQLEDVFNNFQRAPKKENLRLSGWRFAVYESEAVTLGIKENSPGSIYTPPSYRQWESGEVFLVWGDGTCSQSMVQLPFKGGAEYWNEQMEQWRQASYQDPDAAHIPPPESLPLVAVEDREIKKIVSGEDKILFEQVDRWLSERPQKADVQGSIQAAWGYRHVRTSAGLSVTYQQSQFSSWFSFNSIVDGGFAKRRLILPLEQERLWLETIKQYEWMQKEAMPVGPKTQAVLAPSVTGDMLRQFVLPNFSGNTVIESRGAFSKKEFEEHKQVFHEGMSIVVNPLKPLELGSYLVTSEGVPANQTLLVHNGQLRSPFLNIKDAVRWGGRPTAIPMGMAGVYLENTGELPWNKALEGIEDGVLILSVLGLHTQDSVSGSYSLSAPYSLRILKGKIVGKTDCKLIGNFFTDLASPATRTATAQLDTYPYLILESNVQVL